MNAGDLRTGDKFVTVPPEEWAELSVRERNKTKLHEVVGLGPECRQDKTRVHLVTSSGMWCIPFESPVTKLTPAAPAVPAKRRPFKMPHKRAKQTASA